MSRSKLNTVNVSLMSYVGEIQRDLDKEQKKRLKEVGVYLRGKIRANLKKKSRSLPSQFPGKRSGNLMKGIKYELFFDSIFIGAGPPAHHAHLLEYGTKMRVTKGGKSKGVLIKRPFLFPTLMAEKETAKKMLREAWL